MKQTKLYLRPLLMAIVMLVGMLVPQGAWADYLEIYSPNDELLRTVEFENGSATADLEIGQVVSVWLDMEGQADPIDMRPPQKEYFGKEGKESIELGDDKYGDLNVSTTGNYTFTVTQKHTNFVDVGDPEMGYTQEYAGAEATISITCNSYVEHVHVFDQENIYLSGAMVTAPTCTEEGLCKYSCLCGALGEDTFVVSAKGHNFSRSTEEIAVPATCTMNAYCKAGCTRCDAVSDTETLEVFYTCLGHDWHADADGVHHTCQREGCGIQEEHAFVEGEKNEQTLAHEATCTSGPQYYKQCRTCRTISHDENDLFTSGASLPHNWGDDDKCTVCHNDFCDFGEYKDAIINYYGNDRFDEITLTKTDTEAKKIHIVADAQIYVQLNGQEMSTYVTPESGNVNIENGSYEINLRMDDNYTQYGIFVQEEGDYLISLRRPVVNESKIEYDNDNWDTVITHASCILCIEHAHAYEVSSCDWSEDNTAATLHLSCSCGSTVELEATVTTAANEGEEPTCTEDGQGTVTASATYNNETFTCSNPVTLRALGHSYGEEMSLGSDGYHHPVCTREGCDALSEDKYAKMFGEYRKVTGEDNPTATIQLTQVGNKYYTSLYTDFPYIMSGTADTDNVCTYTVSSAADGVVTLRDIYDVPANCGVIFIKDVDEGSVAECTIEYAPHIYSYETTDASPLLTGSETEVTEPADNQYAFGLSDTGYLGFWHWTGMTIPAWKAYLDLSSETATEARGFRIVFDDETNGIQQLPSDASAIEGSYDLMGHKVREVKGLGIVNGKKVFVNY